MSFSLPSGEMRHRRDVTGGLPRAPAGRRAAKNATIRWRCAASGRRPRPAPRLSAICSGLLVQGITAVTASLPRRYLKKNCAQLVASKSPAHSGSFCPRAARKSRLRAKDSSVGGCRVDELAAACRQGLPHLGACLAARRIVADLEHLGSAEPDHRQILARMRDRPRDQPRRAGFLLPRAGSQAVAPNPALNPSTRRREAVKCRRTPHGPRRCGPQCGRRQPPPSARCRSHNCGSRARRRFRRRPRGRGSGGPSCPRLGRHWLS